MKKKFLISYMLIVMGILTACGGTDKNQEIQDGTNAQESDNTADKEGTEEEGVPLDEKTSGSSEDEVYQVGDMISYTSGLKVTIVDSGLYSKTNDFDSTIVDQYAFLEVDMENTGDEDIAITGSFVAFYADGYALSNVWLNEENELPLASDLHPGRKVKGRIYATGPDVNSAQRIEAELGDAVIRVYEYGDYGVESWEIPEDTGAPDLNTYLSALYSIYDGDEVVELYMDDTGKLCVFQGKPSMEETYYTQTYDSYVMDGDTLYGYVGDLADEFYFYGDGLVDVLLAIDGSAHYQSYIQEDVYFNTDWRKDLGFESL